VRKSLSQHEIATVQTTAIDMESGQIRLTTLLAHASGEWISSDWPVCPISETAAPHRMGAALSYARRYALFALVGIAGEDDLDAPDLGTEPSPGIPAPENPNQNSRIIRNGSIHRPRQPKAILEIEPSATLRDQLIAEINELEDGDDLALWAHRRLPAKNTLTTEDAIAVEAAYEQLLTRSDDAMAEVSSAQSPNVPSQQLPDDPNRDFPNADLNLATLSAPPENDSATQAATTAAHDQRKAAKPKVTSPLIKTSRKRNKAHLAFVAAQPCLICKRSPSDAHHLKFAQPRSLGRKVSDEFAVPLCRDHHRQLHHHGNEVAWWANVQIAPMAVAKDLWTVTLFQEDLRTPAAIADRCRNNPE
jgi:hypothetical protein